MSLTSKSSQSPKIDNKWKCPIHKKSNRYLLHLNANSQVHRICQECKRFNNIGDNEILAIPDLLQSDDSSFFSTFPILEDDKALLHFSSLESQFDDTLSQIQQFYCQITNRINKQIQKQLKKEELGIIRLKEVVRESKELYKEISQINQLRQAVQLFTPNSENEIHQIIVNHISKSKINSLQIKQVIEKFSAISSKLSEKQKINNSIQQSTLNLIKQVNFFDLANHKFDERIEKSEAEQLFEELKYQQISSLQQDNNLDPLAADSLFFSLNQLENLNSLEFNLQENKIQEGGDDSLSSSLSQLQNLNSLLLKEKNIDTQITKQLLSSLNQFKTINPLHLGRSSDVKISQMIDQIKIKPNASIESETIYSLIQQFSPLLDNQFKSQDSLRIEDVLLIFSKYQKFIHQLDGQSTSLDKEEALATLNNEKLNKFQSKVYMMIDKLAFIERYLMKENQMILYFIDMKKIKNLKELEEIRKNYQGKIIIQSFFKYEDFKQKLLKQSNSPSIIIMSAQAAGSNTNSGNGDIINFLNKEKSNLRIRGSIIYCSEEEKEYKNLKDLFNDPFEVLSQITTTQQSLMEAISNLVIPTTLNFLIPIENLDFLMPNVKLKFIKKNQEDWSTYNLINLKHQNYPEMIKDASEYLEKFSIKYEPSLIENMQLILKKIQFLFSSTKNEAKLADSLVNLCSSQSNVPAYQFTNFILKILNEELLLIMEPFIDLFFIVFSKYNDDKDTIIKPNGQKVILYGGDLIPNHQLIKWKKENSYVVIPTFCWFSLKFGIALGMMYCSQKFEEDQSLVMYEYEYCTGPNLFSKRPKSISRVSDFPDEYAYIVYPFTSFRIKEIIEPNQNQNYYRIILGMS